MNRYAHGGSLTKIEKQEEGREDVTLYVFSRYRVPDSFDGVAGAMLKWVFGSPQAAVQKL